jgi:hypothetical protein
VTRGWAWTYQDLRAGGVQTGKERYDVRTLASIQKFYVDA